MSKTFLLVAAVLGALSVILGAFADSVVTFETGVRYQFYHTFALLFLGILLDRIPGPLLIWAGYCFIAGIVLFSGSLYLLALLKSTESAGLARVGIITPFGGLFFIAGWVLLFFGILKKTG
jgi:uncharacterized membrane protein YgdD (TMEM256/DUF423 family)